MRSLWPRSELRTGGHAGRQSSWAPRAAGMRAVLELLVEAKTLVPKRTKLTPCPVGRTGPRAQGILPTSTAQRPRHLLSSALRCRSPLSEGKASGSLSRVTSANSSSSVQPAFPFFTEYVLLNPCCVPDTALGCVNLMFPLPGIPALQQATELATLNLSPFKSFITPTVRPFLGPDL